MEKILKFIKQAKKSDLEYLKMLCGILINEIESMTSEEDQEIIQNNIIEEMELEI